MMQLLGWQYRTTAKVPYNKTHDSRLTSNDVGWSGNHPPQQGAKTFRQFLLDTMLRQVAHGRILDFGETGPPRKNARGEAAICWESFFLQWRKKNLQIHSLKLTARPW